MSVDASDWLLWGMAYGGMGMLVLLAVAIAWVTRQRATLSYAGAMIVVLGLVVLRDQQHAAGAWSITWVHQFGIVGTLLLATGLVLYIGHVQRERRRLERSLRRQVAEERQRLVVTQLDWLAAENEANLREQVLREEEEGLHHRLYDDPLLSVPNRRYIEENLAEEPRRAADAHRMLGVLGVRVTKLESVNAEQGRWAGDFALISFALELKRLQETVGDAPPRYGRLDGANFLVLSPPLKTAEEVAAWGRRLQEEIGNVRAEEGVDLDTVFGLAMCPTDGTSLAELIGCAFGRIGPGQPQ